MGLRAKAAELYSRAEPTVGPYVDQAGKALAQLAANVRSLAAAAADRLTQLSKEVPLGSGGSLHDVLFGSAEEQVPVLEFALDQPSVDSANFDSSNFCLEQNFKSEAIVLERRLRLSKRQMLREKSFFNKFFSTSLMLLAI